MICKSRSEFLRALSDALLSYNISDTRDILDDFATHFDEGEAAGENEEQVCERLGDPEEIAKQYETELREAGEEQYEKKQVSLEKKKVILEKETPPRQENPADDTQYAQYTQHTQYNEYAAGAENTNSGAYSAGNYNIGNIIGVLLLDVLFLSWALPTLASLIASLAAVAVSLCVTGLVTAVFGALSGIIDISGFFSTGLAPISCVFLGLLLLSLSGMAGIGTVGAVKGFVNLVVNIINLHARAFVGHNVLEKPFKKSGRTQN